MEDDAPRGLDLSLDDIINQKRDEGHRQYRPDRHAHRHHGAGDWQQQQQQQQPYGGDRRQQQHQQHLQFGRGGVRRYDTIGRGGGRGRGGGQWQEYPQQQHQQQHQYRQQPPPAADYRANQRCLLDAEGNAVFTFHRNELVKISPAGEVTLNSGGHFNRETLASLNDALNPLGVRVTSLDEDKRKGLWSISDGKSLVRYSDGVVLPAKGPQNADRAQKMAAAFQNPNRAMATAATAASNAMAAAAGIIPPSAAATSAFQFAPRAEGSVFNRLGGRGRGGGGGQRYQPY